MPVPKPVSFEVEVVSNDTVNVDSPIRKKLESRQKTTPVSNDELLAKLNLAAEKKRELLNSKVERISSHLEQVKMRKDSAPNTPLKEKVDAKLEAAESKRLQHLQDKVERAKQCTEQVKTVITNANEAQEAQKQKMREKLEQEIAAAELLRMKQLSSSMEKLAAHSEQVRIRKEIAAEVCLSPGKTEIQDRLEAAAARRLSLDAEKAEKAKKEVLRAKEIAAAVKEQRLRQGVEVTSQ
eukprot:Colp12_sorted_trinity150504_noHs@22881